MRDGKGFGNARLFVDSVQSGISVRCGSPDRLKKIQE